MRNGLYLFLIFLFIPLGTQAATIEGRITNGTTGEPGFPDEIILIVPATHEMKIQDSIESPEDTFRFENMSLEGVYLVQVEYQGVRYSQQVHFAPDQTTATIELIIYETTALWKNMNVQIPHFVIGSRDGERLRVDKIFVIINESNKTIYQPDLGTFLFSLPTPLDEHTHISVSAASEGERAIVVSPQPLYSTESGASDSTIESNGLQTIDFPFELNKAEKEILYGIQFPLKPGRTSVNVVYEVPYQQKEYTFTDFYPYDLGESKLFVVPLDIDVESEHLEFVPTDKEHRFASYKIKELAPHTQLSIRLSGGTFETRGKIVPQQNPITRYGIVIIAMVCLIMFSVVYIAVTRQPAVDQYSQSYDPKELEPQKEELLNSIARLDSDFESQKIAEVDYQEKRSDAKSRLLEVLNKLETFVD